MVYYSKPYGLEMGIAISIKYTILTPFFLKTLAIYPVNIMLEISSKNIKWVTKMNA